MKSKLQSESVHFTGLSPVFNYFCRNRSIFYENNLFEFESDWFLSFMHFKIYANYWHTVPLSALLATNDYNLKKFQLSKKNNSNFADPS